MPVPVACRVCWDQGLQTGFIPVLFLEALGVEGWVRVWGFGLDHRLVNFMLQGLASFLLSVTQYQTQFNGEGFFTFQSFSL